MTVPTPPRIAPFSAEEQLLVEFLERSPLACCYMRGPRHRWVHANAAYRAMLPGVDFLGRTVAEVFPELDGQGIVALHDQVYRTGEAVSRSDEAVSLHGEARNFTFVYQPHIEGGEVVGVVTQAVDTTHSVAERRAREADHEGLRQLVDAAPVAVAVYAADGAMVLRNSAMLALTGGVDPLVAAGLQDHLGGVLLGGNPHHAHEVMLQVAGDARWVDCTLAPLDGVAGRRLVLVAVDVSAQVRARHTVEETLRGREAFFRVVSHELRTPLSAIDGWAQLIARPSDDPARVPHGLGVIRRNARLLDDLLADLLDTGRSLRGEFEVVPAPGDLARVVHETVDGLRPRAAQRGVRLEVTAPAQCAAVFDGRRMAQVIGNLVGNAVRVSPPNGAVRVALEGGSPLRLHVLDEGPGVPQGMEHAIFGWGVQGDDHGAMGIGLSLSRAIAELHGGRLSLVRRDGGGAHFVVEIP